MSSECVIFTMSREHCGNILHLRRLAALLILIAMQIFPAASYDSCCLVDHVIDGTSFVIKNENASDIVILADVDLLNHNITEGFQVKNFTESWIQGKKIWLDIDNRSPKGRDQNNRLICAAYLEDSNGSANSSMCLNRMLVDAKYAIIKDNAENEFDPYDWQPTYEILYKEIDRHALNASPADEGSLDSLASYLTKTAITDVEKTRAIYVWITDRIDFDTEGMLSDAQDRSTQCPKDILKTRKALCVGYACLFEALANASGIEAVTIEGYSKRTIPGSRLTEPDHVWNAVKINGEWRLLDCTWGAGHMENGKVIHRFENHYFLTPPEEFICSHLPKNRTWQCLASPISKDDFELLPYLGPDFFNFGLRLESNRTGIINVNGQANLSITVPDDVLLKANLTMDWKKLPRNTLILRDGKMCDVKIALPSPGSYMLMLYARQNDRMGNYSHVITYKVDAARGTGRPIIFPEIYESFYKFDLGLDSPINGIVESDGIVELTLTAPRDVTLNAALEQDNHRLAESLVACQREGSCQREGERYKVRIILPRKGDYDLTISANLTSLVNRNKEKELYYPVIKYRIEASSGIDGIIGFPRIYNDFCKYNFRLIEPKNGILGDESEASINLSTSRNKIIIRANLLEKGEIIKENFILIQRKNNEYDIRIAFPAKGKYDLIIEAAQSDDLDWSRIMAYYELDVVEAATNQKEYPLLYPRFYLEKAYLYTPIEGILKPGLQKFKLSVPRANSLWIWNRNKNSEDKYYELDKIGEIFMEDVNIDGGDLFIVAQFPDEKKPAVLARYVVS
jgi:hypothetical protein